MARCIFFSAALGFALLAGRPASSQDVSQIVCGSVNGDSKINITDVVYLLNYLFQEGNPPLCLAESTPALDDGGCESFSHSSVESCRHSAKAGFWAARANCATLGDALARQTCLDAASAELDTALGVCDAQLAARLRFCEVLATYPDPGIDPDHFVGVVDNPYFPLTPGVTFVYESHTDAGLKRRNVSVTGETREILGVECVVVRELETLDGVVVETSDEWFAQDVEGNVWCFGEHSLEFEDDKLVDVDNRQVGSDGVRAGICMKAAPGIADTYYHQFAPGHSEEIAEVLGVDESVTIRSGTFDGCVKIGTSSLLDPEEVDYKYYAPGIGLILDANDDDGKDDGDDDGERLVDLIADRPTGRG